LQAAASYKAIREAVKGEQERYDALQKTVADMAKTVADLEDTFRVRQSNDMIGAKLLASQLEAQINTTKRYSAEKAAETKAGQVPAEIQGLLNSRAPADRERAAVMAAQMVASPSVPQNTVNAIVGALGRAGVDTGRVVSAANTVKDRKTVKVSGFTPEQQKDLEKYEVALGALGEGGEASYAGGMRGEAMAAARTDAENADLSAYLKALEDGRATVEEFGSEDALLRARAVYDQAKASGSYVMGMKKYFEPTWVDAQARLSLAEDQLQAAYASGAVQDPEAEAARRQLAAMGVAKEDFDYADLIGSPDLAYVKIADRIYNQVSKASQSITPATPTQVKVSRLLTQYDKSGQDWTTKQLERQLMKLGLEKDELDEAIGFALALDRQTREGVPTPDQVKLQEAEKKLQAQREANADAAMRRVEDFAAKAQADAARAEKLAAAEAKRKVTIDSTPEQVADFRAKQAAENDALKQAHETYRVLVESGVSPEKARESALAVRADALAPKAPPVIKVESQPAPAPAPVQTPASAPAPVPAPPAPNPDEIIRRRVAPKPAPKPDPVPVAKPAPVVKPKPRVNNLDKSDEELLKELGVE
jgi:hypothetical protein